MANECEIVEKDDNPGTRLDLMCTQGIVGNTLVLPSTPTGGAALVAKETKPSKESECIGDFSACMSTIRRSVQPNRRLSTSKRDVINAGL